MATRVHDIKSYKPDILKRIESVFPQPYTTEVIFNNLEQLFGELNNNLYGVVNEGPVIEEFVEKLTSKARLGTYESEEIVNIREIFEKIYFKNLEIGRYNDNRCISKESGPPCILIEMAKEGGMEKTLPYIQVGSQWEEFKPFWEANRANNNFPIREPKKIMPLNEIYKKHGFGMPAAQPV